MRNNTTLKNIYEELSLKYKIPIYSIEEICDSQFEFTKKIIKEGNDEPVRLKYLCVFEVKHFRRASIEKRRDRLKEYRENKRLNDSK